MSDTTAPRASRKSVIILTVLATLAAVLVLEKLLAIIPSSEYQARTRRSEALLAAQEQRSRDYQDYLDRVTATHQRYVALLARQEQDAARFEKILDTWQQQEKSYQAYLDSLKPPK